jgi:hypothetical protein
VPEELKLIKVGLLKQAGCGLAVKAATGVFNNVKLKLMVSLQGGRPAEPGVLKTIDAVPEAAFPHKILKQLPLEL